MAGLGKNAHKNSPFPAFSCTMCMLPFRYSPRLCCNFLFMSMSSSKLDSLMLGAASCSTLFMKPKNDWCRVCLQLLIQLVWDKGSYVDIHFMTSKQMMISYSISPPIRSGLHTVLKEVLYRDLKIALCQEIRFIHLYLSYPHWVIHEL